MTAISRLSKTEQRCYNCFLKFRNTGEYVAHCTYQDSVKELCEEEGMDIPPCTMMIGLQNDEVKKRAGQDNLMMLGTVMDALVEDGHIKGLEPERAAE
jgi:hypothetical protein